MKIPKNYIYFSYDGDGIGRKVGRSILANDIDELRHISHLIESGHALVQRWVKDRDGVWINGGGDEGNAAVAKEYISELEQLRKDYEFLVGATMSIGVGSKPSEAGKALLVAKLKGKNQVVEFKDNVEKEIAAIKRRAKKGAMKSMEEMKITDAYLKKAEGEENCPYCDQTDQVDPDHCKYCHDADVQANEESCPYCKGSQNDPSQGPKMPEVAEQDCAYCKEMESKEQNGCPYCQTHPSGPGTSPDSNNDQAPAGSDAEKAQYDKMGMNPPQIGKPDPSQEPPIGQNAPMDVVPKDPELQDPRQPTDEMAMNTANPPVDPEDNHSKESLQSIAQQIEAEGTPPESAVDAVDDADMNSGSAAEGNVSRPEDYNQNVPQDMGISGTNPPSGSEPEEPDLYDLLGEGLDQNHDAIQKEKAIRVVSQALMQFKGCKQSLEAVKMQMPDLYQASISMLKAMIEMSQLLGLGQGQPGMGQPQQELGQEQSSLMPPEEQNDEWHDPFPTHPDHGGDEKPGHSPSAGAASGMPGQEGGAIGQPIGKLSAKHTTEHVARTPMPPGAINAKGQQKVLDPKTGKTRWIDRKQGMVQSSTGVPIKSPSRGNDGPKN